jgi:hypothetical protein
MTFYFYQLLYSLLILRGDTLVVNLFVLLSYSFHPYSIRPRICLFYTGVLCNPLLLAPHLLDSGL